MISRYYDTYKTSQTCYTIYDHFMVILYIPLNKNHPRKNSRLNMELDASRFCIVFD